MIQSYSLLVKSVSGIHWKPDRWSMHRDTPNLYVAIDVDDLSVGRTNTKRDFVAKWTFFALLSSVRPSSIVTMQIFHHNSFGRDDICLARTQIKLNNLFEMCGGQRGPEKDAQVVMEHVEKNSVGMSPATLVVRLTVQSMEGAEVFLEKATKGTVTLGAQEYRCWGDRGVQAADALLPLGSALEIVLSRLDIIIQFGGKLAEIHPFAEAAYQVLTSVYKAVRNQQKTDDKIVKLVERMVDIFSFARDVESLSRAVERLQTPIAEIIVQTEKCAHFIAEYAMRGFVARLVNGVMCDNNEDIDKFTRAFDRLQKSIGQALTVHTALAVTVIADGVKDLVQSDKLKDLDPAKMDATLRPECLPGTRREIIRLITDSLTGLLTTPAEEVNNIFWLYGVAGAGKSTIATSVARHFRKLNRLGAFLFFTRGDSASGPSSVIRSIAYQLALSSPHIAAAVIKQDRNIINDPLITQFQKLLLAPLNEAQGHINGPLVIVLDALDECGDPDSRRSLVSLISNNFHELPPMVRVFITSRPYPDIAMSFMDKSRFSKTHLDITTPSSVEDIRRYIEDELAHIRDLKKSAWKLDPAWPGEKTTALVTGASGLFIWASTAMKMLRRPGNPHMTLTTLLTTGSTLDELYSAALQSTELWDDSTGNPEQNTQHDDARAILAAVVLGKVPMTSSTIDKLLGLTPDRTSSGILPSLGSVLQWAPEEPARLLHASFGDYLTDPKRSEKQPWFINRADMEWQLALGCLQVLNSEDLCFNICELKDSCVPNPKIDALVKPVQPHVLYASRFWANHITTAEKITVDVDATKARILPIAAAEENIHSEIKHFMSHKFLFWLEVLSIIREIGLAIKSLMFIENFVKKHDEALAAFLSDAVKFVITFAPSIAYSAPHIYLSAVPFAPSESEVVKRFSGLLTRKIGIQTSSGDHWPQLRMTMEGHTRTVYSVALSPDGQYVVSGANDKTIRVWDARTGVLVTGPFTGHTAAVNSVAFSPDGKWIASGSKDATILVWDVLTGELVSGPFKGHSASVNCVAFSPRDGERIASSSADGTIRVWNTRTGSPVGEPFEHDDALHSLCFSSDGQRIVTGSADNAVRILNFHADSCVTAKETIPPSLGVPDTPTDPPHLRRHSDTVYSVSLSHDGRRIVSGSADATIRVWDAYSGAFIGPLIHGHTEQINCVAFSPDGKQIASASNDETVRVWDAETGALVAGPFRGHNDHVYSLAFSPDGEHIVSGSADRTLRIWNIHVAAGNPTLSDGHDDSVTFVAFSPDEDQMVSHSEDGTLRIWNAQTGAPVDHPHQLLGSSGLPSISFSPNGPRVVFPVEETVHVWDVHVQPTVADLLRRHINLVFSVGFRVLSHGESMTSESLEHSSASHVRHDLVVSPLIPPTKDETIVIGADGDPPKNALVLRGHSKTVYALSVSFSPDGQRIASGFTDGTIQFWDAYSGARVGPPIKAHNLDVNCVAFSPDGKRIASGSDDKTVRVWDVGTGAPACDPLRGHRRSVWSVAFSPIGEQIVSASEDTTVVVWDPRTGARIARPLQGHTRPVISVAFSPDGRWIASGSQDRTVCLWDAYDLSAVPRVFEGHTGTVVGVTVSSDSQRVASGSLDRTIRVSEIRLPDSITHHPLGGTWTLKDGWIVNSSSQLILWVPAWLREGLYYPHTSLVISKSGSTKLDFSDFAHGTSWQECMRER